MANVLTRVRAAIQVYRHGQSPWTTKASPFIWPAHRQGKPEWQLVDTQAYVEEGFNLNTLIYSAIMYKVRSQVVSPLRAYTGDAESPVILPPGRPLSDLCLRPNHAQSWAEFHSQNVVYLNLTGNCFITLSRKKKGGVPDEMYSLRPDRVFIVPGGDTIKGYLYVQEGKSVKDGLAILPQDMIHVKLPNPGDPLEGMGYGLSPVSPLARSADVDNKVTEFLKLFFDRGTVLSGLLKFDDPLEPETIAAIRERWKEIYGGYGNWAEVGILDQGGDYQRLSMTFEEMGFEGIDERNESRVLGPFGVPPILIGSRIGLLRSTYSNYELARKAFWEDTMVPEVKLFESEFQYHLRDGNAFVAFDFSGVPALQKDVPLQVDAWTKLVDRGIPKMLAATTVGLVLADVPDGGEHYSLQDLAEIGGGHEAAMPKKLEGKPESEPEGKGGEGSGHYGHSGLPGVWGGSRSSGRSSSEEAFTEAATATDDEMVDEVEFLGGGIANAELVYYIDDGRGVWKALHDGGSRHEGESEVIVYELSDMLGLDVVPKTVLAELDGVEGTSQLFIENSITGGELDLDQCHELIGHPDKEKIALLDHLAVNMDRHDANWLMDDDGKLWAIDHGHCRWEEDSWYSPFGTGGESDRFLPEESVDNYSHTFSKSLQSKIAKVVGNPPTGWWEGDDTVLAWPEYATYIDRFPLELRNDFESRRKIVFAWKQLVQLARDGGEITW